MDRFILRLIFLFLILTFFSGTGIAQKKPANDSIPSIETDFGEEEEEEEEEKPKKKIKKKVFYGIKTKRAFTRYGKGKKQTIEMFYYLKKPMEPNAYIRSIFIFDLKKRRIEEVSSLEDLEKNTYKILHGPYKKLIAGEVVEEGIFYVGMKHGRWEKYGKNFTLLDKTKYYKGLLKESQVTYYDAAKTKIKEVIPFRYNQLHGEYYHFKENGQVLTYGKYMDGQKIGVWLEYFPDRNKKKQEMQYPRNPYTEQFEPFVLSQWDDKGNVTIKNGQPFDPKKSVRGRR